MQIDIVSSILTVTHRTTRYRNLELLIKLFYIELHLIIKKTLDKLVRKHQPWMFLKMFSRCWESFIMETTYECMHAWLVRATRTESRYVVAKSWIIFTYDDTLVHSGSGIWKSEKFQLIIRALNYTFYNCFTSFCNRPT